MRLILAIVVALALGIPGAAQAASKSKKKKIVRAGAPAVTMPTNLARSPRPSWASPNDCYTDEGYGRYTICGGGQDY